jgi:hypothetical protein
MIYCVPLGSEHIRHFIPYVSLLLFIEFGTESLPSFIVSPQRFSTWLSSGVIGRVDR